MSADEAALGRGQHGGGDGALGEEMGRDEMRFFFLMFFFFLMGGWVVIKMGGSEVLAGFESGRVAVFRSFFPEDFAIETLGAEQFEIVEITIIYLSGHAKGRMKTNTCIKTVLRKVDNMFFDDE